jgi:short-subunit dehydrogenase
VARRSPPDTDPLIRPLRVDLVDLAGLESGLAPILDEPAPEGVIVCHGQGDFGSLEQFSAARIRRLVDLHISATLMLCRLLVPRMKRAGSGTLILLGSEAALQGARRGVVYCATKFALRGMAQALREECAASGVRVGIINPGMVDTPFFDSLDFSPGEDPANRLEVEEVVDAICLMLDAPRNAVIDEINLSPLKKVIRRR